MSQKNRVNISAQLFGRFEVWRNGQLIPQDAWGRRKTQTLLKILLTERGQVFTQDQLIEWLFDDAAPAKALTNLQGRIGELRRALEPDLAKGSDSHFVLYIEPYGYCFNKDAPCTLDIEEFFTFASTGRQAQESGHWSEALELYDKAIVLYQGDFLEEDRYEDWAIASREHWAELYLGTLERVAECHARLGQYDRAIEACQKILGKAPARESAYRYKMLYQALTGDSNQALQTYQACSRALKKNLKAEPTPETRSLYEEIRSGKISFEGYPAPTGPARHNLPVPLTSFIGREREMIEVKRMICGVGAQHAAPLQRLVTLTGMGGTGKTRLALEVATELMNEYAHGVWWVELAALSDGSLIPQAIATALGIKEVPGRSLFERVIDTLKPKELLLILDNCEHLTDACARLIQQLLGQCSQLQILATSREALGLAGETLWSVPALAVPDLSKPLPDPKILQQYESVSLFLERALARRSDFKLSKENAPVVAQICVRLDGIPLAIELAAARVNALTVEEIAERLEDRFRFLIGGSRTAMPRHQTLHAAVDWSYHLLSESEQKLFQQFSVFAGGWTLDAAQEVCKVSTDNLVDHLTGLVTKSLVLFSEYRGRSRYHMLETVRQYAQEKLRQSDSDRHICICDRHLGWCLRLAESASTKLHGVDQKHWLEKLEQEHDNLRAALSWSLNPEKAEQGLRLVAALGHFWRERSYLSEGRQWMEKMLAISHNTSASLRAKVFSQMGGLATYQGQQTEARRFFEESLALCREVGDKSGMSVALNGLGMVAAHQGDYAKAHPFFEQSLTIVRELQDQQGIAHNLGNLGLNFYRRGDYSAARPLLEESLRLSRSQGDKAAIALMLNNLGLVVNDQENEVEALSFYEESLAIWRELGNKRQIAMQLNNLGSSAFYQGDYARASALLEECLVLKREVEDKRGMALAIDNLGLVACAQREHAKARSYHEQSLTLFSEVGDKQGLVYALEGLAAVASGQERPQRATLLFGAAEGLREAIGAALHPSERADYDRKVDSVRTKLDETTFKSAWAKGRAMTQEQAIEYALKPDKVSTS